MQLLGEQVDTQVSVLAGGGRGSDADDLARTALKHQEIAHADVVGWDGDGVGSEAGLSNSRGRGATRSWFGMTISYSNVNLLLHIMVVVVMMTQGMNNALSSTVKTMSEGVVVT